MFVADCYFHMTTGLSITCHWHGTSAVEERAQYQMSGCLSLTRGTLNILIVVMAMEQCVTDVIFSA